MKEELRKFCKSINIEHMGIAPAEPYYDFEEVWKKQIERGYISGFEEKDIDKRIYPKLTLENAKSVIVCLFPYYTGECKDANLTKSAYSLDYHLIVKEKLDLIGRFLEISIEDFEYKAFVDTGPFSDRYLAYKAGLGYWGINNNIITDQYGSYVFIGYLLNNYPFEPDKPMDRTCMQCMNCVKQCPGQCILGDFTINPLKCKSYITQKKQELEHEEIEILKKHSLIWGCDVCQDVCPHNKNVEKTIIKEFQENLLFRLDYEELSQISNREFMRRYRNRSFSWRGKGVLKRNSEIINE
ncbi:MAG: tRNA epoxyqueuosine(34) reductase QueG [Clostridiales bacterium]|nr:tRNA epoxyqueuosine(34) reductase QueG [Clostridiales bacterium]